MKPKNTICLWFDKDALFFLQGLDAMMGQD